MPGGRPTLLTPEIIEDVRRLLPTVMYLETVGDYLGISRMTWRVWLKRGAKESRRLAKNPKAKPKESEILYLQFFDTHKKALADAEIRDLGTIKKASEDQYDEDGKLIRRGEWQAAAWREERRFPRKWGKKDAMELTGKNKGPVEVVEVVVTSREEAEKALADLPDAGRLPGQ